MSTAREVIADRVKQLIIKHLAVDPEKVTENATLVDDLSADSLDIVELVMACEDEFHCEIPDEVTERLVTVRDVIDFIETLERN